MANKKKKDETRRDFDKVPAPFIPIYSIPNNGKAPVLWLVEIGERKDEGFIADTQTFYVYKKGYGLYQYGGSSRWQYSPMHIVSGAEFPRNDRSRNILSQGYYYKCYEASVKALEEREIRRKEYYDKKENPPEVEIKEEKVKKKYKTPSLFSDKLEARVLDAVSEALAVDLAENIKPKVEAHIINILGYKPQRHEIVKGNDVIEIEGVLHEKFDTVLALLQRNIPVFLTGAAGTGKNHLVKDVARALQMDFYFTNAVTSEYKLSGFIDANGRYHATAFFEAFSKGGVFFFDEVDASTPEALAYTHAAISNGYCEFPTGHVDAHPDFRVVAAGNTFGTGADLEYVGRFQLDAATLDRFALVHIDYSPEIETAMAGADDEILSFIRDFRKALKEAGMKFVVSYRAINRIAQMKDTLTDKEIVSICLTKSLDVDDLRIVKQKMTVDNRWTKALSV